MTVYMFCIDSLIRGHHEYQSIWDNPLLADGDTETYFVNEKREIGS